MPFHRPGLSTAQFRGDPGFFGTLAKIGRGALGIAGTVLPGPVGLAARTLGRVIPVSRAVARKQARISQVAAGRPAGRVIQFGGGVAAALPGAGFGAGGSLQIAGGGPAAAALPGADGCPKGFRLNKSGYHVQGGQFVPPRSRCVRMRRSNPGNAQALRRSLRRVESFVGLVKRTRRATRKVKSL